MKHSLFFFSVGSFFKTIFSVLLSAILFLFMAMLTVTAFPFEGEKEYYLSSASSQSLIKSNLVMTDLPLLRGESARVAVECESAQSEQAYFNEILAKYKASVLKVERFEDGTSYYCYSAKLKRGVNLDGVTVNLHVVIKANEIALGTPIIFGGY